MYKLTTEHSFDAAHFLAGYHGKCRNIHGHRWRVMVTVAAEELEMEGQARGMLVDFGNLKKDLKKVLSVMDHALIVEEGSLKEKTVEALEEEAFRMVMLPFRPTAENFSRYFYEEMSKIGYPVESVSVYETPGNCAVYEGWCTNVRREEGHAQI